MLIRISFWETEYRKRAGECQGDYWLDLWLPQADMNVRTTLDGSVACVNQLKTGVWTIWNLNLEVSLFTFWTNDMGFMKLFWYFEDQPHVMFCCFKVFYLNNCRLSCMNPIRWWMGKRRWAIGDRGKWLWKIPRNLNKDKVMFSLAISDWSFFHQAARRLPATIRPGGGFSCIALIC